MTTSAITSSPLNLLSRDIYYEQYDQIDSAGRSITALFIEKTPRSSTHLPSIVDDFTTDLGVPSPLWTISQIAHASLSHIIFQKNEGSFILKKPKLEGAQSSLMTPWVQSSSLCSSSLKSPLPHQGSLEIRTEPRPYEVCMYAGKALINFSEYFQIHLFEIAKVSPDPSPSALISSPSTENLFYPVASAYHHVELLHENLLAHGFDLFDIDNLKQIGEFIFAHAGYIVLRLQMLGASLAKKAVAVFQFEKCLSVLSKGGKSHEVTLIFTFHLGYITTICGVEENGFSYEKRTKGFYIQVTDKKEEPYFTILDIYKKHQTHMMNHAARWAQPIYSMGFFADGKEKTRIIWPYFSQERINSPENLELPLSHKISLTIQLLLAAHELGPDLTSRNVQESLISISQGQIRMIIPLEMSGCKEAKRVARLSRNDYYIPPELAKKPFREFNDPLFADPHWIKAFDSWGLGIVLYRFFFQEDPPWFATNNWWEIHQKIIAITAEKSWIPTRDDLPAPLIEVITQLLDPDPLTRLQPLAAAEKLIALNID